MKQNKKTPSAEGVLITIHFKDQKFSGRVDEIHPQEHQKNSFATGEKKTQKHSEKILRITQFLLEKIRHFGNLF
ncbi:hypothetical protein FAE01_RS07965 [Enterococcus hirae]